MAVYLIAAVVAVAVCTCVFLLRKRVRSRD
jgi:hypothetical protein